MGLLLSPPSLPARRPEAKAGLRANAAQNASDGRTEPHQWQACSEATGSTTAWWWMKPRCPTSESDGLDR